MPPEVWDDIGIAIAAIITALATLVGSVWAWVKWRAELRGLRAELRPTGDADQPDVAPDLDSPGTAGGVLYSSHQLLVHLVNQVDGLTQSDGRIEAWGKLEHTRLDQRIDELGEELGYQIGDHEQRLTALEAHHQLMRGTD